MERWKWDFMFRIRRRSFRTRTNRRRTPPIQKPVE
jgi:hypothetical protein